LHFHYTTREFNDRRETEEALKKHDSEYSKNGNFEKYMLKIKTAVDNSKKLYKFALNEGIGSKSHTTFHVLIEELLGQVQKKSGRQC